MTCSRILVVAGTDCSGGAGLTRDVLVARHFGVEVAPVVTAVTAQTDETLVCVHPVPEGVVRAQIKAALATHPGQAVKIGMLGSARIAQEVAQALRATRVPIVVDPVLKSSSGGVLFEGGEIEGADMPDVYTMATLLTPNLIEAATLTGRPMARDAAEIAHQASVLQARFGGAAILMKGGHAEGTKSVDHLFSDQEPMAFSAPRRAVSKRGTGCSLATAIACRLAQGSNLQEACRDAKSYISKWLGAA